MSRIEYVKDPHSVRDLKIDWADWLSINDETGLAEATFDVPVGLTKQAESHSATTATVRLAGGGAIGSEYVIINHIVTDSGQEEDQTILVLIQNR